MPAVETKVQIEAPLHLVWKLAQDVERFPQFMPDLDEVRILERQETSATVTRVVTDWRGRIKQFNRRIEWTEEDIWNSEDHTCRFWQLKGDFNDFRGEWKFSREAGGTAAHLSIEYRFDIPLLGAMMAKVLQKLMQENCDNMLTSLKHESEAGGANPL